MNTKTLSIRSMIRSTAMATALIAGSSFALPALASAASPTDAGTTWLANKYPAVYGPRFNLHAETQTTSAPAADVGKAWLASKYPAVYGPRFNLHAETQTTTIPAVDAGKTWLANKYPAVYGPRFNLHGQ